MIKTHLYKKINFDKKFLDDVNNKLLNGELSQDDIQPFTMYEVELYQDQISREHGEKSKNVESETSYNGLVPETFLERVHTTKQVDFLINMVVVNLVLILVFSLLAMMFDKTMISSIILYGTLSTIVFMLLLAVSATKSINKTVITDDMVENIIKQKL